jgi:seryl-tRNA(Sec) selenium transferase
MGADLVVYAAKYFDAPHSTGLLAGRRDLIDVALTNSFVGFESSGYLTMGRAMKVDRQEIAATVVALREWLAMDHEARFSLYAERIEVLLSELGRVDGADIYRISERETPAPVQRDGVRIDFDDEARSIAVETALRDGDPCIWVKREGATILVSVAFFGDDDLPLVTRRLREALGS